MTPTTYDTSFDGHEFQPGTEFVATASIVSGDSNTDEINLGNRSALVLIFPSAMDGTQVTFLGSLNGIDFYPVYSDDGTEFSVAITPSAYVSIPASFLLSAQKIKIRTGTSGAPTVQTATRTILLQGRVLAA